MGSLIVVTASHRINSNVAIAAVRAGETGILDLGHSALPSVMRTEFARFAGFVGNRREWGVRWDMLGDDARRPAALSALLADPLDEETDASDELCPILLLAGVELSRANLAELVTEARTLAPTVFLEAYSAADALAAHAAGVDAVVLKGNEASCRASEQSSFLLLQTVFGKLTVPYYVQGGIGPDTAAAAMLAGAAGVVLCEQLWLADETPFTPAERQRWAKLDGSETAALGDGDAQYRFYCPADRAPLGDMEREQATGANWTTVVRNRLIAGGDASPIPLGQEIAFAAPLARDHGNVAGILGAFKKQIEQDLSLARSQQALARDSALARTHGTDYPILQGPMTRVSDVAPFCDAVADNGALPFLALALMRGPETRTLLDEAKKRLGSKPWGVGVLGFVPAELRKEQLEVIHDVKPPFAIIAGGRPSQAVDLEKQGIPTYLHVPSPGLLELFIRDGSRKFIFEGRECGGHVGPRGSFTLWQSAINVLSKIETDKPEEFQIVFAGGIHDSLSAAMVATAAAPLVKRGMQIGVLMGTAYLFTEEAVTSGAILPEFQKQAIACGQTVLLESGLGHATRCVRTPFADEFVEVKREMIAAGHTSDEIRLELEMLNVGRLRIASKGVTRGTVDLRQEKKTQLVEVNADEQRRTGMYMIGQVAALREGIVTLAELHAEVSDGAMKTLSRLSARKLPWQTKPRRKPKTEDIAIIGMACMFPEAKDAREYWHNIMRRLDAVREVPRDRWHEEDFFSADRFAPDQVYSKWGGFLKDIVFDPVKWRIPPASLKSIDPVQLMALEIASQALRDAGYDRRAFPRERTGVLFACAGSHEVGQAYCFRTLLRHYLPMVNEIPQETRQQIITSLEDKLPEWTEDSFPGFLMNVVAGRITNRLDLLGPNYVVDAACAASFAALHAAIEQLRSRTSDVVLVGGADGTNNPFCYMSFAKTHALSPRGRSRPFDDSADGIALGEGVASVVLKRLADAERDGDRIYSVIKGIGSSSDGKNRSLTAPFPAGQMIALERAYEDAGFSPSTVTLVEAHGTGTAVGDSTEIKALTTIFSQASDEPQYSAIGSVKSMIGHTKTVAGLASLIKTSIALKQKVLPPTIGVEKPSTLVDFAKSPFYINAEPRPWLDLPAGQPRRAGVSAFGFGGTNFHVVLEEYRGDFHSAAVSDLGPRAAEIINISRGNRAEMKQAVERLQKQLSEVTTIDLAQLAYSVLADEASRNLLAATSRACRLSIVAESLDDLRSKLVAALKGIDAGGVSIPSGVYYSEAAPVQTGEVCWLFPGQGSQAVNMLRDLAMFDTQAEETFGVANRVLAEHLDRPISRYIYPVAPFSDEDRNQQLRDINDTRIAQPALGTLEMFALNLLQRFGVEAGFAAGHSFGEYTALYAAGVLSADDFLTLAAERGKAAALAAEKCPGAMAAVFAGGAETVAALKALSIDALAVNFNAPEQTVIAGSEIAIQAALERLPAEGLRIKRIPVSAAFHTPAMAAAAGDLREALDEATCSTATLKVFSNTTAKAYPPQPEAIRDLLTKHFESPVLWEQQVRALHEAGARVFVEVGPGSTLTNLVDRILKGEPHVAVSLDAPGRDGTLQLAQLLASLSVLGLSIQWDRWFAGRNLNYQPLADALKAAAIEGKPKPTDWILNSAKADPVTPLPTRRGKSPPTKLAIQPAIDVDSSVSAGGDAPIKPATFVQPIAIAMPRSTEAAVKAAAPAPSYVSHLQEARSMSNSDRDVPGTSRREQASVSLMAPPAAQYDALAQFQATMAQWLDLQQSQHRASERFLETQEKVMCTFLAGGISAAPAGHAYPAIAASSVALPAPMAQPKAHVAIPVSTPTAIAVAPTAATPRAPSVPALQPTAPRMAHVAPAAAPIPAGTRGPVGTNGNGSASGNGHAENGHSNGHSGNGHPASAAKAIAPASAATSIAVASEASGGAPPTSEFQQDLLEAVSERTGYPVEMLDLDLKLEAGLGIDSIKTVEIFSNLKKYHGHFREEDQDEEELLMEFTKLKTLRDIIDAYEVKTRKQLPAPAAETVSGRSPTASTSGGTASAAPVERYSVEAVHSPLLTAGGEKKNSLSSR